MKKFRKTSSILRKGLSNLRKEKKKEGNKKTPHYTLAHLSSTTTPSAGSTTQSIIATESATNKGLHLKPWHGEENHKGVFRKIATPTSVAVVGAKAQSFLLAADLCHHEVPKTSQWAQIFICGFSYLQCQQKRVNLIHSPLHLSSSRWPKGIATVLTMMPTGEPTIQTVVLGLSPRHPWLETPPSVCITMHQPL